MNYNPIDDIVPVKPKSEPTPGWIIRVILHHKGKARLILVNGKSPSLWQRIKFFFERQT